MVKIGVDIVEIDRIQLNKPFIHKILTDVEYQHFAQLSLHRQKEFLAGRFAAKEAIFKATQDIHYLNYAILNDKIGVPYVVDHAEISISISHEKHYAIAFVVIM